MIHTYRIDANRCRQDEGQSDTLADAAWIDLFEPTTTEESTVERIIGADIPTREEMAALEASSRCYLDHNAAIMTTPVLVKSTSIYPENADITFVLTDRHFITVRYAEPASFAHFATAVERAPQLCAQPREAFAGLLNAIIDRIAEILQEVGYELDELSRQVFATDEAQGKPEFAKQLKLLGRNGDIVSKARESLVGLARVVAFARRLDQIQTQKPIADKLRTVGRDVETLTEHAGFLSDKITFLLDAMLGMINIEQNAIIKFFSVVAVVFLPPTLVASIYGMNFETMPELTWTFGYPLALGAMVVSMIVPYLYFKTKKWI